MTTYFKGTKTGIEAIELTALWVEDQAASRGISLHAYVEGHCTLTALGITSKEAAKSLKPMIPNAHIHYNAYAAGKKIYASWEQWFSQCLRNRIYYFFHKHGEGCVYRCWAGSGPWKSRPASW